MLQSKILTVFSRDEFKQFKMSIEIKNEDISSALGVAQHVSNFT